MGDWLTYSIHDFLMYAPDTYYRLIGFYNEATWPLPFVAGLISLSVAVLLWERQGIGKRVMPFIMALGYLAAGLGFFRGYYADINWAGDGLAAAFAVQGLMWLMLARFETQMKGGRDAGLLAIAALAAGLALPFLSGRPLEQAELPLMMPDPTVILTFAVLMAYGYRAWPLAVIPAAWAMVGGAFLYAMESPGFWLMPLGLVVMLAGWVRRA